jgi:hypothetical protein
LLHLMYIQLQYHKYTFSLPPPLYQQPQNT